MTIKEEIELIKNSKAYQTLENFTPKEREAFIDVVDMASFFSFKFFKIHNEEWQMTKKNLEREMQISKDTPTLVYDGAGTWKEA